MKAAHLQIMNGTPGVMSLEFLVENVEKRG